LGEFDSQKQADVLYQLRGDWYTRCTKTRESAPVCPAAWTMTNTSTGWENVGVQAAQLAKDLADSLQQLLAKWKGPAADEFSTNVAKVVHFAQSIAHVADSTHPAPPAPHGGNVFSADDAAASYKQIFDDFRSHTTTFTSVARVPCLPWEDAGWYWKWYGDWGGYQVEARNHGTVFHGDLDGGDFEHFMQQYGIESKDYGDGGPRHSERVEHGHDGADDGRGPRRRRPVRGNTRPGCWRTTTCGEPATSRRPRR